MVKVIPYDLADSAVAIRINTCYNIVVIKVGDDYLKRDELLKRLKKAGFVKEREGGKHTLYENKETGVVIPVPRHRGKEIATGTAERILKLAGIKI